MDPTTEPDHITAAHALRVRDGDACPGIPFAGNECCDEHGESWTRSLAEASRVRGVTPHRLASAAGVHEQDMTRFLAGLASLTPHARARLRQTLPGMEQP